MKAERWPQNPIVPPWLAKWADQWPRLAQVYLQLEPRSLGAARIAIGALLLANLFTRHESPLWSRLLAAAAYVFLLFGFHTRVAQALSLVAIVGLNGGVVALQSGTTFTLPLLCLWTLWLPLQLRFSLDSLLTRLRTPKEVRPEALAHRHLFAPTNRGITSLAVAAMMLHLTSIAFTSLAPRTWQNVGLACACVLLVSPFGWRQSRIAAALFALVVAVSAKQASVAVVFLLFLPDMFWTWIARVLGPSEARRRIVYIDAGCGVCFALSRLLARLDTSALLTIVANDQPERPLDLSDELVQSTIVVDDPVTKQRWLKAAAFAQIFAALPAGAPFAWILRMPVVAWIARPAYDLFARNRTRVSVALGMAACGLPQASAPIVAAASNTPPPNAARRFWATAREAGAVLALVAAALLRVR